MINKLYMCFLFIINTRHNSVSCNNLKVIVTGKVMLKLFSCDYLTTHYIMVKYYVNLEMRLILTLQEEKWHILINVVVFN